jgi:hypothetical protein
VVDVSVPTSGGGSDDMTKGVLDGSVTEFVIPEGITKIRGYAFNFCTELIKVSVPSSVQIFDAFSFANCVNLQIINIPYGVTTISADVFHYCNKLLSLTIPASVTTIGTSALNTGSTTNKATFRFEGTTPPSIESSTFYASYLDKIEVPMSAVDVYKTTTNWSKFADYIVGYE